jgi:hypothetical protein
MGGWLLLVVLSTMTTYQHQFLDLPTGALAGLLAIALVPESRVRNRQAQRLRLATFYLSGSVLATAIAFKIGGLAWILLWLAAALLVVALAYAADWPGVFRLSFMRPILAPYTAGAWINSRCWTRGEAPQEITDGVWLGRAPLSATKFSSIVNLAAELHAGGRTVPMLDLVDPTRRQLQEAVAAIEECASQRPTLVCCALGYSRSASAVAAWLMASGRARSTTEAVAMIQCRRPRVVLPHGLALSDEVASARRV